MKSEIADELAKKMADRIGHGMREKCYVHAEVAEEFFSSKTDDGAEVPCSGMLSDVLKLLKKDFALSQRMVDDMKAKDDEEMVDHFEIKRGHTRELIRQVEALGR